MAESTTKKPKLVLAYSGGLDTSVILKWLCDKGFEVVAFCANVGQFEEDFSAVQAKALSVGAVKCVITDLRKEFVTDYVYEAIKCNAMYEGRYLLGTSIARPCIAKEMIRVATEEGASYIGTFFVVALTGCLLAGWKKSKSELYYVPLTFRRLTTTDCTSTIHNSYSPRRHG
jgi:tRNA U34 2-thiouridine synthase MnmA/TrmU